MDIVAIVVPIYKTELSYQEKLSLEQLYRVLGHYHIYFVAPKDFKCGYVDCNRIIEFDKHFFEGLKGYNELMLNSQFYVEFKEYEYILIYQLDAFVFRDSLLYFCKKKWDYVGAPWLMGGQLKGCSEKYYVGNGGLSLRKVSAFIRILSQKGIDNLKEDNYEDIIFSSMKSKDFCVPSIKEALEFSFETYPELCYLINDKKLPFGCHAWTKHRYDFWCRMIGGDVITTSMNFENTYGLVENKLIEIYTKFQSKKRMIVYGAGKQCEIYIGILRVIANNIIIVETFREKDKTIDDIQVNGLDEVSVNNNDLIVITPKDSIIRRQIIGRIEEKMGYLNDSQYVCLFD